MRPEVLQARQVGGHLELIERGQIRVEPTVLGRPVGSLLEQRPSVRRSREQFAQSRDK
jgi:hypothetical protein